MDLSTTIQLLTGAGIVIGLYLNLRKFRKEDREMQRSELRDDYDRLKKERDELRERITDGDNSEAALSFVVAHLAHDHPAIIQQALAISRGEIEAADTPSIRRKMRDSDPLLRLPRNRGQR